MLQQPIFKHARQAIAFAYLLEGVPVRQDSPLGMAVRKAMLESGQLELVERGSINLEGLSDLEVHGQCAMIRLAVEGMLPGPEGWAIKARYGHTHVHLNPDKTREFFFSEGRLAAMRSLVMYLSPIIDLSQPALMLLLARYCAECEQLQPSLRLIEKEGGGSIATLSRRGKVMRTHVQRLIEQGVKRLEPLFVSHGLIEEGEKEVRHG